MEYTVYAPEGIPCVQQGDNIAAILEKAFSAFGLKNGDILLVAHKIISKAEGRLVRLDSVEVSPQALHYAELTHKDPRLVELVLRQSSEVLWCGSGGPLLCVQKNGFICADAGVDSSNAEFGCALLLPEEADASAERIRVYLAERLGMDIGVLICDTHGRAFRIGACGIVIGASGVALQRSYIGRPDLTGRIMKSSVEGVGDELAAAATLLMGQGDEGRPAVCIRGLADCLGAGRAADLIRPPEQDIFVQAVRQLGLKGK